MITQLSTLISLTPVWAASSWSERRMVIRSGSP